MVVFVFRYRRGSDVVWKSVVPTTVTLMYAPVGASVDVFPVK